MTVLDDRRPGWLALVTLLILTACSSYDAPPLEPEIPTTAPEISGFVTNGSFGFGLQPMSLKGRHGYGPIGSTDSAGLFSLGTQDLSPPFIVEAGSYYAVAPTGIDYMDVTPFTTMQVMVLGANDPSTFYNNVVVPSGRDGVPDMIRFTPTAVAAAQSTVIEVMKEDASFIYQPDTMSFVATRFKPNGTDPMVLMLNDFNNQFGDPFAFAGLLIPEGKRCRAERVYVIVGPRTRQFCPALKSNLPDETDATVTVYGSTNARLDSLQVRVRGSALVGVTYTRHDEEAPYTCSAGACGGVSFGATDDEGKRPISFVNTRVSQAGGATATLFGSILAPDPGPPRPPDLECAEGLIRVSVNYEDGSLRQGCQFPGFFGTPIFDGITSAQMDPFNDDGASFSVVVRSQGSQVLSVAFQDPNTGALYFCRDAACGPVAATTPLPDGAYEITLSGATLTGINQDGTPSGMPGVTISATAPLQAFAGAPSGPPCQELAAFDTLTVAIDGGATVNLCIGTLDFGDRGIQAFDFGTGDTNYVAVCGFSQCLTVVARDGVVSTLFVSFAFGDNWYNAEPTFAGVTTTGPDADNLLGLNIVNAQIRDIEAFGIPGVRTAILNGSIDSIPFITFNVGSSIRAKLLRELKIATTRRLPPSQPQRPKASRSGKSSSRGGKN